MMDGADARSSSLQFDHLCGHVVRCQYPDPIPWVDQYCLSELMIPEGAHHRSEDVVVFFLSESYFENLAGGSVPSSLTPDAPIHGKDASGDETLFEVGHVHVFESSIAVSMFITRSAHLPTGGHVASDSRFLCSCPRQDMDTERWLAMVAGRVVLSFWLTFFASP